MKKIIVCLVLLLSAGSAAAQLIPTASTDILVNHYPNGSGTIKKSGYTYKYRYPKLGHIEVTHAVEVYNAASTKFLDAEWGHKDGSDFAEGEAEAEGWRPDSYYMSSSKSYEQLEEIVAACFSSKENTILRGSTILIRAMADPATGRVEDVYFSFNRDDPGVYIPVETFRKVELALKEQLTIVATPQGKKFNFLDFIWEQKF